MLTDGDMDLSRLVAAGQPGDRFAAANDTIMKCSAPPPRFSREADQLSYGNPSRVHQQIRDMPSNVQVIAQLRCSIGDFLTWRYLA
nr:hypothetical protein CFP56_10235 [Quercus suber]